MVAGDYKFKPIANFGFKESMNLKKFVRLEKLLSTVLKMQFRLI